MTNTEKIESVVKAFAGKTLSVKQVQALVLEAFPDTPTGSILVSDHSRVRSTDGTLTLKPGQATAYADGLFEATATGYRVLPANEIQRKPTKRGARGQSLAEALASAKALIAANTPSTPSKSK